jgi:hypothetical protein
MITLALPIAAVVDAVRVKVLVPVAVVGLNEAFTPPGSPDVAKLTLPLNPFCGAIVSVLDPEAPCVRVKLEDEAESVKFSDDEGQLFTRFAALTVPIPVAKFHPVLVP